MKKNILFFFIISFFILSGTAKAQSLATDNFVFTMSKWDAVLAKQVGDEAENLKTKIMGKLFGGGWKDKTGHFSFNVCPPDKWQIIPMIQAKVPVYLSISDGSDWRDGEVSRRYWEVIPGIKIWTSVRAKWMGNIDTVKTEVAPHEISHVALLAYYGNRVFPRWADEGLAETFESETRDLEGKKRVYDAVMANRYYDFDVLFNITDYPEDQFNNLLFYAESETLVEYLTMKGCGKNGYKNFVVDYLTQVGPNPTIGSELAALKAVYKDERGEPWWPTLQDLERDWLAWVKEKFPRKKPPIIGRPKSEQYADVAPECRKVANLDFQLKQINKVFVIKYCNQIMNSCKEADVAFEEAKNELRNGDVIFIPEDIFLGSPSFIEESIKMKYLKNRQTVPTIAYILKTESEDAKLIDSVIGIPKKDDIINKVKSILQ